VTPDATTGAQTAFSWPAATIAYYEQTLFDYRAVWLNRCNLAFHFGFHDDEHKGHAEALENTNRALARIGEIGANDRVLDAGCGLGGSSFWLAESVGAQVVGITLAQSQVDQARRIAARRGLADKVGFERANFTCTPFPSGSFDVVWALESLCHAEAKPMFYSEAARLLRPGGRLVIAEFIRTTRRLHGQSERVFREWLDGWAIPDLDTEWEHTAAAAAGFSDISMRDCTGFTRPSLTRLYRMAVAAQPLNEALHLLGVRNRTQHDNVVSALRQYQALEAASWFYGVLSATRR
jgi:cyclopropane fatty-acyl-phospholipid synthase-like methyltransferase